ncbi:MAG: hypothetical protein HQ580_17230 [Planctomycetes bacterium]|nr:hypothetical protein [Planctomycetota bacterium]
MKPTTRLNSSSTRLGEASHSPTTSEQTPGPKTDDSPQKSLTIEGHSAEELLLQAVEGRCIKLSGKHPHTLESLKNLIMFYEVWGKP